MRVYICIRKTLTFKHVEGSNIPIALATPKAEVINATFLANSCLVVAFSVNLNLSKSQE